MKFTFQNIISYILHPVVIPTIATLLYFILVPNYIDSNIKSFVITAVFVCTYIIPILVLLFLKRFNFISSIKLENLSERKIPILLLIIITYQLARIIESNDSLIYLSLIFYGMSLSLLIAYLLLLIKFKVSLHIIAVSGLIGAYIMISFIFRINLLLILAILFYLTGVIASSRLKLKAHSNIEVIIGFILGLSSEIIVFYYYSI